MTYPDDLKDVFMQYMMDELNYSEYKKNIQNLLEQLNETWKEKRMSNLNHSLRKSLIHTVRAVGNVQKDLIHAANANG